MLWSKRHLTLLMMIFLFIFRGFSPFVVVGGKWEDSEDSRFRPKLTRQAGYRNLQEFASDGFITKESIAAIDKTSSSQTDAVRPVVRGGMATIETLFTKITWKSVAITLGGALWTTGLAFLVSEWFYQVVISPQKRKDGDQSISTSLSPSTSLQKIKSLVFPSQWIGLLNRFYILTVGTVTGGCLYWHGLAFPHTANLMKQIGIVFATGGMVGSFVIGGFRGWWALLPGIIHTVIAIANMSP